jgi:hypothetical protein
MKNWFANPAAAILLVVSNLVPLAGVALWDWDVVSIIMLYWSENLILGAYTLVKMIARAPIGGWFAGLFFVVHYGGFCGVHGMLVLALSGHDVGNVMGGDPWPLWFVFVQILYNVCVEVVALAPAQWWVAFAALALSHGVSLGCNYFLGGEYRKADLSKLMHAPYKRIVVLHLAIIFGGWGVIAMGSPLPLLIMLVLLKMGMDLYFHQREHRARLAEPKTADRRLGHTEPGLA